MQESSFPGANSPERVSFRKVIAQGAPIDFLGAQLVSISTAAVPATRFRVPAEPVAAALVREQQDAVRAATSPRHPTRRMTSEDRTASPSERSGPLIACGCLLSAARFQA